ncbi:MAG TPA: hypothetical protein VF111_07995, partial [Thermoanaerobaculia bacterium]
LSDPRKLGYSRIVVAAHSNPDQGRVTLSYFNPRTYQPDFYTSAVPSEITGQIRDVVGGPFYAGSNEESVVVLYDNHLVVFGSHGHASFDFEVGGTEARMANVDDEANRELVINGPTVGRIFDPGSWLTPREYPGGFGTMMKLGNVDADARAEIVFGAGNKVTIVNGEDLSSTTFTTAGTITAIAVIDGRIAVGEAGLVSYYTPAGVKLWSVSSPISRITEISGGDVDGDGVVEIVFTAASDTAGMIGVAANGQIETTIADERGPYVPDVADLDRDGRAEIVVGSSRAVRILDYVTRASKGTLPFPAPVPNVLDLRIGQLDGDPAYEIVVHGRRDGLPAGLWVFDGATRVLEWSSEPTAASNGYMAGTLHVKNLDSDPVDEIIVAYDSSVYVFSGASDAELWISPAASTLIRTVTVGDVDSNGSIDIAATDQFGTTVYTRALNSSRPVPQTRFPNASAAGSGSLLVIDDLGYWTMFRSDGSQAWTQQFTNNNDRRRVQLESVFGKNVIFFTWRDYYGRFDLYGVPAEAWTQPVSYWTGDGVDTRHVRMATLPGTNQPLLLRGYVDAWSIDAADTKDIVRGDVNLDGTTTDVDIDVLARYLYGDGPGIPHSANVNGTLPIDGADLVYLINYRKGTGPAPRP